MKAGSNKLQLDFRPLDPTKISSVTVTLSASEVDPSFEKCLDSKYCLRILDDGSDAGFEMRNKNGYQLGCLQDKAMESTLKGTCERWVGCLKAGGTEAKNSETEGAKQIKFLTTLMRAAGVKGETGPSSLLQGARLDHHQKDNSCIDPAIEDPEAMSCECMESFHKQCNDADDEACFKKAICDHKGVCTRWKEENDCAVGLSLATLGQRATQTGSSQGDLDKTVEAKGGDTCN